MGKRWSWFGFVKRLLIPESKPKEGKKSQRWKCVFRWPKLKQQNPAIEEKVVVGERRLSDAKKEQRKHAFAVAVATAAAAQAAMAAATAAAEVVRLTGFPDDQLINIRHQNSAATKIQSIYRAHLARKALKALKGVVRLQAVIRGQLVRRQITNQLRSLQCIANIHTKLHHTKAVPISEEAVQKNQIPRKDLEKKQVKLESKSARNWVDELFPKQDKEVIWSQKQDTDIKRERMKKYSFSQRERRNAETLDEIITMKADRSHHFEQKGGVLASKMRYTENKKSTTHLIKIEKPKNGNKQEDAHSPSSSLPRRSFSHTKRGDYFSSCSDDTCLTNSPVFPSYMASTESAKAKARSISNPKQRLPLLDIYSLHSSSSLKPKLTSWSSFNGDLSSGTSQHVSLGMK